MTQYAPTFSPSNFELRNYTQPYLEPAQAIDVAQVEERVNGQLNFLAQMLGWNGPNYWGNLPSTPDQKRQLLGGTFGVYNSYVIPNIYEIRNWSNRIIVDKLPFLVPGRPTQVARILVGDDVYSIQSVEVEGDFYVISIGTLSDTFFQQVADNVPIRVDIPTYRPAPFYRPSVGISGDYSFVCSQSNGVVTLYPAYDTKKQFPFKSPVLFAGSVYYFDQPIYLSVDESSLDPFVSPEYNENLGLWYFQVPQNLNNPVGFTGFLVWAQSNSTQANNSKVSVAVRPWGDPSDWNSINVLDNFRGVWGNKGGDLPFNFVFDALSIHGFNEFESIFFPGLSKTLNYNDIVNYIYYQKTTISPESPPGAQQGDLWWNDETGALAVWLPNEGCGSWVEIDYRQQPRQTPSPQVVFASVGAFQAAASTISVNSVVRIDDISGLSIAEGVIGVQGTLNRPGWLVLHRAPDSPYWIPDEFGYANVADFDADALLLPYKVPVTIYDATGLSGVGGNYNVSNLSITISGDYEVLLMKCYNNNNWEIFPDSILKYIAFSSLFGGPLQGQMWWDFVNADPNTRSAAIYYASQSPITQISILDPGQNLPDNTYLGVPLVSLTGTGGLGTVDITVAGGIVTFVTLASPGDMYVQGEIVSPLIDPVTQPLLAPLQATSFVVDQVLSQAWVNVNTHPQSGPPALVLDLGTVLFYCNGNLLKDGVTYLTDDFSILYSTDPTTGKYSISYTPRSFSGRVQLPTITISDNLTTIYRADITDLVFSGITYYMSPNTYNAETPLRLWKAQALQVAETVAHLEEDNYINPLVADLNNGPGPENWERYFVRLPLEYGRNDAVWQKVALTCQDFAYWGSSIEPEMMRCPPEDDLPAIYEELFLYDEPIPDYTYVYSEPYLYSNIAYFNSVESGQYQNSGVFPASDVKFDEFSEAELIDYEPLHNRQAFTDLSVVTGEIGIIQDMLSEATLAADEVTIQALSLRLSLLLNKVYGDWQGVYVNINPCVSLTGFLTTDILGKKVDIVTAPVWDASIYKFAPTCENAKASYNVDANHYRVGYAYFVADASAAEDAFFDVTQEAAWRYPLTQPKTLYLTPR